MDFVTEDNTVSTLQQIAAKTGRRWCLRPRGLRETARRHDDNRIGGPKVSRHDAIISA